MIMEAAPVYQAERVRTTVNLLAGRIASGALATHPLPAVHRIAEGSPLKKPMDGTSSPNDTVYVTLSRVCSRR
jgi:hypothetical protein